MKRINITLISPSKVLSAYKSNSEYQAWIDACIASGVWGAEGNYTIEVLDASAELEAKRNSLQTATKIEFDSHANNTSNPHSVTKAQIGLDNVDNVSAASLRDRSTHTGTQSSSTISDFNEAAQDAVGNALIDSADIDFNYPDVDNQISAQLTSTGVVAGTYSLVTVDAKGRVTSGSNSGPVTRYAYSTTTAVASTSTTYASVTELTTISLPVGLYAFRFHGNMRSAAVNTGVGVRVAPVTATMTTVSAKWNISQGANGTAHDFEYDQTANNTNITSTSVVAANTNFSVNGFGVFRITVAGTVAIQTRTESAGTAATLQLDSAFILELV